MFSLFLKRRNGNNLIYASSFFAALLRKKQQQPPFPPLSSFLFLCILPLVHGEQMCGAFNDIPGYKREEKKGIRASKCSVRG